MKEKYVLWKVEIQEWYNWLSRRRTPSLYYLYFPAGEHVESRPSPLHGTLMTGPRLPNPHLITPISFNVLRPTLHYRNKSPYSLTSTAEESEDLILSSWSQLPTSQTTKLTIQITATESTTDYDYLTRPPLLAWY